MQRLTLFLWWRASHTCTPHCPNCSTNPCPCGYYGDPTHECTCSLHTVSRYQRRISGPLLDRIDIHLDVPRVEYDKLTDDRLGEPSAAVRERVQAARAIQHHRFGVDSDSRMTLHASRLFTNADMGPAEVREHCRLDEAGRALLRAAVQQLGMSARAFTRILKLSRTIADLEGVEEIKTHHLAEALQYRPRRM